MTPGPIGQPVSRIDGPQKVTGAATYAAEFDVRGQVHAAIVRSTIANGRIAAIDTSNAQRAAGVLAVITHRDAPKLPYRPHKAAVDPAVGERLHVLQDDRITHQGQPIALVVAETLEQAAYAARLVGVTYTPETPATDVTHVELRLPTQEKTDQATRRPPETKRGDPDGALATAPVKVDHTYVMPREHHNPIELHATIAAWDGDRLTLWDKSQWVHNTAEEIAAVFGIPAENVRVISPFVGGAFGSALRTWPHVTLAALGARVVGRPVKLMLSRREMYYSVGHHPYTVQRVALGASRRRPSLRDRARRLPGDFDVRGILRGAAEYDAIPLFMPERLYASSPRRHEHPHPDPDARSRRGERQLCPGVCDGRARCRSWDRPR